MQALHLCFFLLFDWKALVVNAFFFFPAIWFILVFLSFFPASFQPFHPPTGHGSLFCTLNVWAGDGIGGAMLLLLPQSGRQTGRAI